MVRKVKKTRILALLLALCFLALGSTGCRSKVNESATDTLMSEAMLAYQCFVQFSFKVNQTITGAVEIEGRVMRQVIDKRFHTMADLRAYAETYFSDEICDKLLAEGHYLEQDGTLYSDNFDYAIDESISTVDYIETSRSENEVRYEARVIRVSRNAEGEETSRTEDSYEYVYQKTDRGWVFVTFPYFWEG